MVEQNAQIANISLARAKGARIFTSAVSATALVSLFVVLSVQLLGRL